jgi:uncharacterized protein
MGNVLRFLLILIGVGIVLMILRRALARRPEHRETTDATQRMVQCLHCGVHVLESEALFIGKQPYCSEAHRKIGPLR